MYIHTYVRSIPPLVWIWDLDSNDRGLCLLLSGLDACILHTCTN